MPRNLKLVLDHLHECLLHPTFGISDAFRRTQNRASSTFKTWRRRRFRLTKFDNNKKDITLSETVVAEVIEIVQDLIHDPVIANF